VYQFFRNNFKYVNNAINGTTGYVFAIWTLHTYISATFSDMLKNSNNYCMKFNVEVLVQLSVRSDVQMICI